MDFSFTDEQTTISSVARELFDRYATPERLTEIEAGLDRHDPILWRELADSDLLGIALPESVGGSGQGFVELGMLLAEAGWSVAPVPVFATLVLGADTIARLGTPEQHRRHLTEVVTGGRILSAGLLETGRTDPTAPITTAHHADGCWTISGSKELVPAGQLAHAIVVSATADDTGPRPGRPELFVIDTAAAGVTISPVEVTDGEPYADLRLDGVVVSEADRLSAHDGDRGDGGDDLIRSVLDRAIVGLCAVQVGVVDRALRMAGEFTSEREQFGRPIGSFQAVQQRLADAFIDVEVIRWTTWQAAWLLAEGRPADRAAAIAKFWAAEAGARVVASAQQVHGGIGIDVTYPLSRYFLHAKQNELMFGSASHQLIALGAGYAG